MVGVLPCHIFLAFLQSQPTVLHHLHPWGLAAPLIQQGEGKGRVRDPCWREMAAGGKEGIAPWREVRASRTGLCQCRGRTAAPAPAQEGQ